MRKEDWIKVTDRLPENDDLVLITYRDVRHDDIVDFYYVASYIEPLKRWVGDGLYNDEPTHWMPIVPPR
jgi:hypothetical protein